MTPTLMTIPPTPAAPADAPSRTPGSTPAEAAPPALSDATSKDRPGIRRNADERGDYAIFIAIIAAALLFFAGVAYDAPRVTAARQDAIHSANEAARVAAATIAAGGTVEDAQRAAAQRMAQANLIYGASIHLADMKCVGSRAEVTIQTWYEYQSVMRLVRHSQFIEATGAAEAQLTRPGATPVGLHHLGECPLLLP